MNQLTNNSYPASFQLPSNDATPMTSTIPSCGPIDPALLHTPGSSPYLVYSSIEQSVPSRASTELSVEQWAPSRAFTTLSVEQSVLPRTSTASTHRRRAPQSTRLTEKQDTALLQICLQMESAYVAQKKRTEF